MNYTSIEQSEKLLKLGLNSETADMCYQRDGNKAELGFNAVAYKAAKDYGVLYIPCWSTGALLKILQNNYTYCKDYWIDLWISGIWIGKNEKTIKKFRFNNDTITPFYEVICWMLENHYI